MSHGPACVFCSRRRGWMVPLYAATKGKISGKRGMGLVGYACQVCARGSMRQWKGARHAPVYSSSEPANVAP